MLINTRERKQFFAKKTFSSLVNIIIATQPLYKNHIS